MIKLQVIGNLGKDGIVSNVNGKTVINFSVAHTERYKDSAGALKERTIWIDCAYWTEKTGIAPYLKKGTQVYVEGSPDVRSYTTNDGRAGASLTLRVSSVQLIGSKNMGDGVANSPTEIQEHLLPNQRTTEVNVSAGEQPFDDLPF